MTSAPRSSEPKLDHDVYEEARVWDWPTRVFHWLLVVTATVGWVIGENMSFSNIEWHFYLGYATGGLIAFRIIWGLVGPKPVRLRALVPTPAGAISYAKTLKNRSPSGSRGHNPLGAVSVLALLATLTVLVTTGLLSESEDLFATAPLAHLVDKSTIQLANAIHEVAAKVIMVLVGLHVAALVFYAVWKRENLVRPMLTGVKIVRSATSKRAE